MSRRAYLYFLLTFLLGVLVGAAGFYDFAWSTGHWRRKFSEDAVIKDLTRRLGLTSAQVDQLRGILDDSGRKWHDLQKQVQPMFSSLHADTHQRIRQILAPDQLTKYNALLKRIEERRKKSP